MDKKKLTPAQQRRQETRRLNGEYDKYDPVKPHFHLPTVSIDEGRVERTKRIREGLYTPATSVKAAAPATTTAFIDDWWDQAYGSAEFAPSRISQGVPMMMRGDGNRYQYKLGAGYLRMPSKTSIRRFLANNNTDLVDVPYGWTDADGNSHQGWLRVGCSDGVFETRVLDANMGPETSLAISETVTATLENRRAPFTSLREIREHREARQDYYGHKTEHKVNSSFIDTVDYDEKRGTMFVAIGNKGYEYECTKREYEYLIGAESVGRAYNLGIKKDYKAAGRGSKRFDRCEQCGRFASRNKGHVCPVWRGGSYGLDVSRERARATAAGFGTKQFGKAFDAGKWSLGRNDGSRWWSLRSLASGVGKYATGSTKDKDGAVFQFAPFHTLRKTVERDVPPNGRAKFARVMETAQDLQRVYGDDVTFTGALYSPKSKDGERLSVTGGRLRDPQLAARLKEAEEAYRLGEPDRRIDVLLALNEKTDMEFGRITRLESDGDYVRFDMVAES